MMASNALLLKHISQLTESAKKWATNLAQKISSFTGQNAFQNKFLSSEKWPLYCPQGSGTLRQQLLMMHGIAPCCTRVCHSMPEYARVCQSMQEYARVCKSMPEYARVCLSMPEYAGVLPSFAKVVPMPKSSPDGSESESPMLLSRPGVI